MSTLDTHPEINDLSVLLFAKRWHDHAVSHTESHCLIPTWALARLIERAERPHD